MRRVVAHPAIWGVTAAVALLALAAPALGMRLGEPAVDVPPGQAVAQTTNAIQRAFPQAPSPAEVVVTGPGATGPRVLAAVAALQGRAATAGPIHEPVTATAGRRLRALVVDIPLAGHGSDSVSDQALATLRNQILPATLGRVPGIRYAVTGDTASEYDFTHQLHDRTPVVLGLVTALAFVLLLIAFRSVGISLVSVALNLLSVGAAYGLITLIFQDGRLQGLLGYTSFGGIISWVPLFMFVFLFGISMDYHVFILSRIRELWSRGSTAHDAVVGGIASSAGVVTSAALIMVAVFSIFATLPLIDLKILGIGTAAAVLIDATVVRGILVPAALTLLGDRAWRARTAWHPPRLAQRANQDRLGPGGRRPGGARADLGADVHPPAGWTAHRDHVHHGRVLGDAVGVGDRHSVSRVVDRAGREGGRGQPGAGVRRIGEISPGDADRRDVGGHRQEPGGVAAGQGAQVAADQPALGRIGGAADDQRPGAGRRAPGLDGVPGRVPAPGQAGPGRDGHGRPRRRPAVTPGPGSARGLGRCLHHGPDINRRATCAGYSRCTAAP